MRMLSELRPGSGLCWLRDELAGLFKSLDQYSSNGKGTEAESILLETANAPSTSEQNGNAREHPTH